MFSAVVWMSGIKGEGGDVVPPFVRVCVVIERVRVRLVLGVG